MVVFTCAYEFVLHFGRNINDSNYYKYNSYYGYPGKGSEF